jgi:hypothetical protein
MPEGCRTGRAAAVHIALEASEEAIRLAFLADMVARDHGTRARYDNAPADERGFLDEVA